MGLFKGIKLRKKEEKVYAATDVGRRRTNNEDTYLILPARNLFIVADGMGGHNAGEIASANTIRLLEEYFTEELISSIKGNNDKIKEELIKSLIETSRKISNMANERPEYSGMGCTIVIAYIDDNILHTSHLGDARVYVCNKSEIIQLTEDHSTVTELVKNGQMTKEEARISPLKNQITQAVGFSDYINPGYNQYLLKDNDIVLLCSDGLWDMLTDEEIHAIVTKEIGAKDICKELIKKANEAGGEDNITVCVIKYSQLR